jgi:Zn-dependent protease/predicted transcriptional regulator
MTESIRLGTIAGVKVGVNWSVLVIFFLIAFGLGAGQFPAVFPDLPAGVYVAAGLIAAVVFFLSLLAHELAHAIVARRNGLEVEGITLWLFGGVARLGGEAPNPGAELRIAGVGPLVSIVLGVGFLALAVLANAAGAAEIVIGVLGWLGAINLVLAVFNLIPGAPLDGGRLLRAFLWSRHGDRYRAAVTAARMGRGVGIVLIAIGLFQLLFTGTFGGLWLALIGWFLIGAATAEEQHAQVQSTLGGVRVRDVMTADPTAATGDESVQRFIDDVVFGHRYSTFPLVADGGRPTGLVTLNRIKQVPPAERATTTLMQIACPMNEVPVARPEERLTELLPRMAGCTDGRALVIDRDRLVGIVSPTDITRTLQTADLRSQIQEPERI